MDMVEGRTEPSRKGSFGSWLTPRRGLPAKSRPLSKGCKWTKRSEPRIRTDQFAYEPRHGSWRWSLLSFGRNQNAQAESDDNAEFCAPG